MIQCPARRRAFLPTQLTSPALPARLASPVTHPFSLQSSRPNHQKPQAPNTHLARIGAFACPSQVPISAKGLPLCLPRDLAGTQARLTPSLALPHSPQLVFIQSYQFFPQISVHSPRAPALCWPGSFPVGPCSRLLLDDPASRPPCEGPSSNTQISTCRSPSKLPRKGLHD